MKNPKLFVGISVVALILAGIAFYKTLNLGADINATAVPGSSLLIENYVPVVKYNGGIYSELPIQTTSTLTSNDLTTGIATLSGDLIVTTANTATSSALFGCWQTYATSTASPIRVMATTTLGPIVGVFGLCP